MKLPLFVLFSVFSISVFANPPATEVEFMKRARDKPRDVALRLEFADWLQANGQKQRAKFIRLMVEDETSPPSLERLDQLSRLIQRHQRELAPGLPARYFARDFIDSKINFVKGGGFPLITVTLDTLANDLSEVLGDDASPVIGLVVHHDDAVDLSAIKQLRTREELARVAILYLEESPMKARKELLRCATLSNLRELWLGNPGVAHMGSMIELAHFIAQDLRFSGLQYLRVPVHPSPTSQGLLGDLSALELAVLASPILGNLEASPLIASRAARETKILSLTDKPIIPQRKWSKREASRCPVRLARRVSKGA